MSDINRKLSVFLDGEPASRTLKNMRDEFRRTNNELARMVVGSEEYEGTIKRLGAQNAAIREHETRIRTVTSTWDKVKVSAAGFLAAQTAAFGAETIVNYAGKLFDMGVMQEQLAKKAATVLGPALATVTAEAERNAAAMGLTTSQYVAAAAGIADLLIPMGMSREEAANISTELTNLSGALSEWTGGQRTAEDVTQTLQKALLGEREELKGLGISISQAEVDAALLAKGMDKLTGQAKQQATAMVTLEMITQKSADAQAAYADNEDSLIRKKAELSAKIQDIAQKMSKLLMPVFERLTQLAEMLLAPLGFIANGFAAIQEKSQSAAEEMATATKEFQDQAAKVSNLESNVTPLLDRYDELAVKTNLTAKEQKEMKDIVTKVTEVLPGATQDMTAYGGSIQFSTDAARQLIVAEKEMLKIKNEDLIKKATNEMLALQMQANQIAFKAEATIKQSVGDAERQAASLVNEVNILNAEQQSQVSALEARIAGLQKTIETLSGDDMEAKLAALRKEQAAKAEAEAVSAATQQADKEREARTTRLAALLEELNRMEQEAAIARMASEEAAIARVRLEMDEKINAARELGAQGADIAAAYERMKEERIDEIRADYRVKRDIEEQQDEIRLEAQTQAEIDAVVEKENAKAKAEQDAKQNVINEIYKLTTNQLQQELDQLNLYYAELIAQAEKYGLDVTTLKQRWAEAQAAIEIKRTQQVASAEEATQNKIKDGLQKRLQAMSIFGDAFGSLIEIMGDKGREAAAFQKALGLFQIGIDTAIAISGAVAQAQSVPFPGNLIAIATGVATVLANIARAKKLISAEEVPQRAAGGYYNVTGADDGLQYNARMLGQHPGGMLPGSPSLVLASERGPEYYVPNYMLRNPMVLNAVNAIESIRVNKGAGTVPQYADGGYSSANGSAGSAYVGAGGLPVALLEQLVAAIQALNQGVLAIIPDQTIVDLFQRKDVIDRIRRP
jgi:hypothetical protein